MANVTIKVKDEKMYGRTTKLPVVGLVEHSAEGEIEVEESVAQMLIESELYTGWEPEEEVEETGEVEEEDDNEPQKSKKKESLKSTQTEKAEKTSAKDGQVKLKEYLSSLSFDELVNLAIENELPEKEYSKYKSAKTLMAYLLTKVSMD